MIVTDNRELRIGAWRVDPRLMRFPRTARASNSKPRAMRVLLCLAEHAGQVVSVEQLLDAVWKDVVVTPTPVYQAWRRFGGHSAMTRKSRTTLPMCCAAAIAWWRGGSWLRRPPPRKWTRQLWNRPRSRTAVTPATIYSRARWPWWSLSWPRHWQSDIQSRGKLWPSKQATIPGQETTAVAVGVGEPSVAVLRFVDLSDKKDQSISPTVIGGAHLTDCDGPGTPRPGSHVILLFQG